jgi:DNA topoisomerase 2-associated protein PAT1
VEDGKRFDGLMSFFGFEQGELLERERQRFLEGGQHESEDVAVYTWGEENYDGLGEALQEGNDELNDETFGDVGPVGERAYLDDVNSGL